MRQPQAAGRCVEAELIALPLLAKAGAGELECFVIGHARLLSSTGVYRHVAGPATVIGSCCCRSPLWEWQLYAVPACGDHWATRQIARAEFQCPDRRSQRATTESATIGRFRRRPLQPRRDAM